MELVGAVLIACWVALVTPRLIQVDLAEHRLPNAIVMPGWPVALAGLAVVWLVDGKVPVLPLAIGLGALVASFVMSIGGGLGMGDVKLSFPLATGLGIVGADATLAAAAVAVFTGGVTAVVTLLRTRDRKARIAFGPCLLLGYWVGYVAS